jgi:DNA-binding transcriptional LysR family regulator
LQLRNGHNGERCCPGAGHRNGHARRSYENAGAAGIPISLRRQVTLAEHERLTDAATALRMNQPTLSRLLARVELELGTRLFERDARGVHTNPYGEVVLAAARDIAHRYDQLRDDLANLLDPESGTVRLAFLDSMATSLVPRILHDFRRAAPTVRIALRQEPGREILLQPLRCPIAGLPALPPERISSVHSRRHGLQRKPGPPVHDDSSNDASVRRDPISSDWPT